MGRKTVRWNKIKDLHGTFPGRLCSKCQGDGFVIEQFETWGHRDGFETKYVEVACECKREGRPTRSKHDA
jgi:hypothetical protein